MRTKILLGLSLAAILPLMGLQVSSMTRKPYLWFFPFAWLLVAYLIYRLPNKGFAANRIRRVIGQSLVLLAAFTLVAAALLVSPALAHLSSHVLLLGWLLLIFGFASWTRLVAISSLAWIAWPLNDGIATRFSLGIERYARTIASNILDFGGVKHYLSGNQFDLPNIRMDFSGSELYWHGPLLLLFVGLAILVLRKATLLPSLAFLVCIPLVSLLGRTLLILSQVWASEFLGENWSAGSDAHLYLRLAIFALELVFVWLAYVGVSFCLAPIPADSEQEARRGVIAVFNTIVVWPMVYSAASEEVGYYEEDDPVETKRSNRPDYVATKNALEPFLDARWYYAAAGSAGLALLLGMACWLLPKMEVILPEPMSDTSVATLIGLPFGAEIENLNFISSSVLPAVEQNVMTWSYTSSAGPLMVKAALPSAGFVREWESAESGLTLVSPPRRRDVISDYGRSWPVLECELEEESSGLVYAWYTAVSLNTREPLVPEQTVSAQLKRRLSQTLIGRFMGGSQDATTCMMVMELRTDQVKTRRTQRELSEKAAQVFQEIAAALPEI